MRKGVIVVNHHAFFIVIVQIDQIVQIVQIIIIFNNLTNNQNEKKLTNLKLNYRLVLYLG